MTGLLALTGAGLALLAPVPPGRRRLLALVGSRLPSASRPTGGSRLHRRGLVILPVGGLALIVVLWGGLVPGLLAGAAVGVGGWAYRQLARERSTDAELSRLAAVVAALAAEHAAGASIASALATVAAEAGPWQPALAASARMAAGGADASRSLRAEPRLAALAAALGLASRTGAPLADVLQRLQGDAQAARQRRRGVAEAVSGARASALLLAGLPLLGLAMGAALGANPVQVLFHTAAGLIALSIGVCLDLLGVLWTLRLTR